MFSWLWRRWGTPDTDRIKEVMLWMEGALAELDRAHAGYACVGAGPGGTEAYTRAKLLYFRFLKGKIDRAAPDGRQALLEVLAAARVSTSIAEDVGEEVYALVQRRVEQVTSALSRFLTSGEALPDPARTI